jgi:NTP pyrophosphatase (non-canonical NTP hydrolase)
MTPERSREILEAGTDAAFEKMSSAKCLLKKEITELSFLELYARMVMEQKELEDEIRKAATDYPDTAVSTHVLEAIRSEAGDVIAFAAGLVAKADRVLEAQADSQPRLFG